MQRARKGLGIEQLVMVGNRGMKQRAIDELRATDGLAWIAARKRASIRALVEQGHLQLGLFYERNLLEPSAPEYPGGPLVACRDPEPAKLRTHGREELLAAIEKNLEKIKVRVAAARFCGAGAIGVTVSKVVDRYEVARHFELTTQDEAVQLRAQA